MHQYRHMFVCGLAADRACAATAGLGATKTITTRAPSRRQAHLHGRPLQCRAVDRVKATQQEKALPRLCQRDREADAEAGEASSPPPQVAVRVGSAARTPKHCRRTVRRVPQSPSSDGVDAPRVAHCSGWRRLLPEPSPYSPRWAVWCRRRRRYTRPTNRRQWSQTPGRCGRRVGYYKGEGSDGGFADP